MPVTRKTAAEIVRLCKLISTISCDINASRNRLAEHNKVLKANYGFIKTHSQWVSLAIRDAAYTIVEVKQHIKTTEQYLWVLKRERKKHQRELAKIQNNLASTVV